MGLILTVVYLLYMLGSPAVWLPFLAQASVQVYVSFLAVVATAPRLLSGSVIRHTPQIAVFCGFFTVVVASPLLQRWAGGVILAFREMAPFLLVLLLVRVNCDTVAR